MPIYEYCCEECGKKFDTLRSFSLADAPIDCKYCQSPKTRRALSLFNAKSNGKNITASSGCGSCSGGSCSTCGH